MPELEDIPQDLRDKIEKEIWEIETYPDHWGGGINYESAVKVIAKLILADREEQKKLGTDAKA